MPSSKDPAEVTLVSPHSKNSCHSSRPWRASIGSLRRSVASYWNFASKFTSDPTSVYGYGYLSNRMFFEASPGGTTVPLFSNIYQESNLDHVSVFSEPSPQFPLQPFTPVHDESSARSTSGIYSPLPTDGQFRLLEILPGDSETIRCKLHVCSLKENETAYEALSYTWGTHGTSDGHRIEIITDGKSHPLAVTESLNVALRDLRRSNASRLVWADAVCINQKDVEERGHQVAMMEEIYSGAWQVIIWLGEDADFCSCGQTIIESSLSSVSEAFSVLCALVNDWLVQCGHKEVKATFFEVSKDGQSALHDQENVPDYARPIPIQRLFRRRWFSRIWVIQESVLARHAVVQLGQYQIPWEWVGLAAALIAHKPELTDDYGDREQVPIGAMNAYLMYRLCTSQSCFPPLEFSFAQLLQVTRLFDCKESKDKVYGLLGIPTKDSVNKKIVPDYSKATSMEMVYQGVTKLMLESDSPLTFLSGAGTFGDYNPAGPSWVPSWQKRRPWTILPTKQDPRFQCGMGIPMKVDRSGKTSQLSLQGVLLDGIKTVQQDRGIWGFLSESEQERESFFSKPRWSDVDYRKYALTLTCGGDGRAYPVEDEATHLADFAAGVLSHRMKWTLKDLITVDEIIEPVVGGVTHLEYLTELAKDGDFGRYVSAVAPVRKSYRVFTTESKLFGVGPVDMMVGDRLCVFFGAEVPFLLRPKGDGYLVVGECYVYDIMHGEILGKIEDGSLEASWVKLV
ncbi:hypothetical protein F53441_3453 [Fusarium austroafricanum]|uniref:Heterokaryon incompatibility domain-containing protein n=1 Tax=Fusarium austroafricanum TaxID=2364996 RepID=A0A8H4KRH1_9HYPO|nr:hypothetical protein F53441_3453 [Fusarium austroafricanum]